MSPKMIEIYFGPFLVKPSEKLQAKLWVVPKLNIVLIRPVELDFVFTVRSTF